MRDWQKKVSFALVVAWGGAQLLVADIAAHPEAVGEELPAESNCVALAQPAAWICPARRPVATIVLVHGYGAGRNDLLSLTAHLQQHDFTVLLPELPYTSGARAFSGGPREADVAAGALRWAERRGPVVAMGVSAGGHAVLRAVAAGAPADAVIVDSTYVDGGAVVRHAATTVTRLPSAAFPFVEELFVLLSRGGRLERLDGSIHQPTLVIHGEADRLVPSHHAEAVVELTGGALWLIPDVGHVQAYSADRNRYVARVERFITSAVDAAAKRP